MIARGCSERNSTLREESAPFSSATRKGAVFQSPGANRSTGNFMSRTRSRKLRCVRELLNWPRGVALRRGHEAGTQASTSMRTEYPEALAVAGRGPDRRRGGPVVVALCGRTRGRSDWPDGGCIG
jgi:hypothetical protein